MEDLVSREEVLLQVADLSDAEAKVALLILAASSYKKYQEAAKHALQMLKFDNTGERTAALLGNIERLSQLRNEKPS